MRRPRGNSEIRAEALRDSGRGSIWAPQIRNSKPNRREKGEKEPTLGRSKSGSPFLDSPRFLLIRICLGFAPPTEEAEGKSGSRLRASPSAPAPSAIRPPCAPI